MTALFHVILLAITWISPEYSKAKHPDFHCLFHHGSAFVKNHGQISTWILFTLLHIFIIFLRDREVEKMEWNEREDPNPTNILPFMSLVPLLIIELENMLGCSSYSSAWNGFYFQSIDIMHSMKLLLDEITLLHHCCKIQFHRCQYQLYTLFFPHLKTVVLLLLIIFVIDCVVKVELFLFLKYISIVIQLLVQIKIFTICTIISLPFDSHQAMYINSDMHLWLCQSKMSIIQSMYC